MIDVPGFRIWVLLLLVAALLVLRWRRVGSLAWVLGIWVALYCAVSYGFETPVPSSVVRLYMAIVSFSLAAYFSSSRERWAAVTGPVTRLIVERDRRWLLVTVAALLPVLLALNVYLKLSVPLEAPSFPRTIHPAPPETITVHEQPIDLMRADNPYLGLADRSPDEYRTHVQNGRRVYYQNCFFCHGDGMAGDGMFAHGLNPIPSNFTDVGVLPNLQSSFVFWRVSKGGPGLPEEGGPWDSAMPIWERMLSVDEVWDVVLFLYDFNGYKPRAVHSDVGE